MNTMSAFLVTMFLPFIASSNLFSEEKPASTSEIPKSIELTKITKSKLNLLDRLHIRHINRQKTIELNKRKGYENYEYREDIPHKMVIRKGKGLFSKNVASKITKNYNKSIKIINNISQLLIIIDEIESNTDIEFNWDNNITHLRQIGKNIYGLLYLKAKMGYLPIVGDMFEGYISTPLGLRLRKAISTTRFDLEDEFLQLMPNPRNIPHPAGLKQTAIFLRNYEISKIRATLYVYGLKLEKPIPNEREMDSYRYEYIKNLENEGHFYIMGYTGDKYHGVPLEAFRQGSVPKGFRPRGKYE